MIQSGTFIKPWVRTVILLPAFLFIVGLFQGIGYIIHGLDPMENAHKTPFHDVIDALFTLMGTVLVVWLFSHFIDKIKFRNLGFNPKGSMQQLIAGFILGVLPLSFGFITLNLFQEIHWQDTNLIVVNLFAGICLFILVALSEEILFRGYVLNNLMQSMSRGWALIISSFMFSFIHIINPNFSWFGFINILLAGVLIGLPYLYTKQLWFPIAVHFSWNFFQGPIFGFNVSGQETYSLIIQSRSADTIWNGGTFGFEGSLLCTIIQVIIIGGLWWYYHKKEVADSETVVIEGIAEAEFN